MKILVSWLDAVRPTDDATPWPDAAASATFVAGRQSGPALAAAVRAGGFDTVVLLCEPDHVKAARYVATVITGACTQAVRVSVLPTQAGAMPALVRATQVLKAQASGTATLELLEASLQSAVSGAWFKSVGRLKAPTPSVAQFVRSLLPGKGYITRFGHDSVVFKRKQLPLFFGVETPARVWVATSDAVLPPLLERAFIGADLRPLPPARDLRRCLGESGAEFLVDETPTLPDPTAAARCPVCGDPVGGTSCPYCHARPKKKERNQ